MAHSIIDHVGTSTSPSISGSANRSVIGPPVSGASGYQGVFTYQSGSGASQTFRWVKDEPAGTSPASYSFNAQHRS